MQRYANCLWPSIAVTIAAILFSAGCGDAPATQDADAADETGVDADSGDSTDADAAPSADDGSDDNAADDSGADTIEGPQPQQAEVTLKVVDRAGYNAVLEKHKGKVVLVDYWATYCIPCMQQFPHTVKLSEEHPDDEFAVVSLSVDDPDEDSENVLQFLKKQNATFDNLISQFGESDQTVTEFDYDGVAPYYKLYDKSGQLRYRFSDSDEELEPVENIDKRIEELLAEEPS